MTKLAKTDEEEGKENELQRFTLDSDSSEFSNSSD